MRVVIHIGTPKTGTTFFQGAMVLNGARLADEHKFLYPRSGRLDIRQAVGSQMSLLFAVMDDDHGVDLVQSRRLVEPSLLADHRRRFEAALDAEIAEARPRMLLMSCEHLYRELQRPQELLRLRRWIEARSSAPPVIVVVIREQAERLESTFAESVRSGATKGMGRFLRDFFSDPEDINRRDMDYNAQLSRWAETFGDEALRVVRYREPGRSGDIVDAVGAAAGLPDMSDMPRPPRLRASPPMGTLQLMRLRNVVAPRFKHGVQNPAWNSRLARKVDRLTFGRPVRLSSTDVARVRDLYAASNREAARRWFGEDALFP